MSIQTFSSLRLKVYPGLESAPLWIGNAVKQKQIIFNNKREKWNQKSILKLSNKMKSKKKRD